jgi:hypothetical protein
LVSEHDVLWEHYCNTQQKHTQRLPPPTPKAVLKINNSWRVPPEMRKVPPREWRRMSSEAYFAQIVLIGVGLFPAFIMWLSGNEGYAVLGMFLYSMVAVEGRPQRLFGYD